VPFLENACCNEVNKPTNPFAYFADADPLLVNYLQSSKSCIALLKDIKELSKAPILYHPTFTGVVYPSMPTGHLESNVYAAFIHYCKFDRPMPVPEELRAICGEKPTDYNPLWTLEEKMESLKRHGKRYTVEDLYNLMNIVEKRNTVFIKETPEISEIAILKDLLAHMDMHESSLIEYPLRKLLNEAIDILLTVNDNKSIIDLGLPYNQHIISSYDEAEWRIKMKKRKAINDINVWHIPATSSMIILIIFLDDSNPWRSYGRVSYHRDLP
jgi:hypothetical protein